jgi:hypothetical protein
VVTEDKQQEGAFLGPGSLDVVLQGWCWGGVFVPALLLEELEVDFKDGFEEAHVCALVESNLMFP